jgi:hypothetical protein
MPTASIYNPGNLSCKNAMDHVTYDDFESGAIYVPKTSAAGATLMYCIDPANFEDAQRTEYIIDQLFTQADFIPGFNCADLSYIRPQITNPESLAVIDNAFVNQGRCAPPAEAPAHEGPSKGFMLFLRGAICCLKSAQEKASQMAGNESSMEDKENAQAYRGMLMIPLLNQILGKIASLPGDEARRHADLPFISPVTLYFRGNTLSRYLNFQLSTGHCGLSINGDLTDFYNFNKRKYFRNDDMVTGIPLEAQCSLEFINSHCRLGDYGAFPINSNIVNPPANAAHNTAYSSERSSNNNSASYARSMRMNGAVQGGRRRTNKRRNRNKTTKRRRY